MTDLRKPLRLNLGFLVSATIGTSRDFTFDATEIRLGDDFDLFNFEGIIKVTRTPQGLLTQGNFRGSLPLECVRCLNDYEQFLSWEFTELFAFTNDNITDSGLLMPEDGFIDFEDIVREYGILEIPISPICTSECKGLCPVCGENLNEVDCGHRKPDIDSPFSALKDLIE
ncbi:MAG: DUF177 domain-containing protein [Anaerolineales bacterium]